MLYASAQNTASGAGLCLHLIDEALEGRVPPGVPPNAQSLVLMTMAESYIYQLDSVRGALSAIIELLPGEVDIADALARFDAAFLHLVDVRDSMAHREERAQGRVFRKPLPVKGVEVPSGESVAIFSFDELPETGNIIADVRGRSYVATMRDGRHGVVPLDHAAFDVVLDCMSVVEDAIHDPTKEKFELP